MSTAAAVDSLKRNFPKAQLAHHTLEVACSPEAFYSLVTDYESYPEFVPNQTAARILSHEEGPHGERWNVDLELSLVKNVRYEIAVRGTHGRSVHWELVHGNILRANVGGWIIEELPNGHTRATLYMAVVLKGWFPKSLINMLVNKSCPKTVEAFKAEAERRATM